MAETPNQLRSTKNRKAKLTKQNQENVENFGCNLRRVWLNEFKFLGIHGKIGTDAGLLKR